MRIKKLLSLLLVVALVFGLVACGNADKTETPADDTTETEDNDSKTTDEGEDSASSEEDSGDGDIGGKLTITWRDDGQGEEGDLWKWMENTYENWEHKDKVELDIAPITASEGDYFAKIALSLASKETAPDIVTEDTFMLPTDAAAGYLLPLDDRLAEWDDWNDGLFFDSMKIGVTGSDGKIYGIPYSTDTRGLWYNKEIFKKAGLPEDWQPKDWDEVLDAARAIKENVPDVVPIWMNSGKATGEATSMQTYEMLLYGTGERLMNEDQTKYIVKSQGILDTLNFIQTVYKEELGPPLEDVLTGQGSNNSARVYMPEGRLGISLDGNWIIGNYLEEGASPWPEYSEVLGLAAMPTQNGQEPGTITLAGGWALSIPKNSDNHDAAFSFITTAMSGEPLKCRTKLSGNLTTHKEAAKLPEYAERPFVDIATKFLETADFRPKDDQYPQVSTQIQIMVESVVTGTDPEKAMETYAENVKNIVGADKVMTLE